jgi:hypothetical protein
VETEHEEAQVAAPFQRIGDREGRRPRIEDRGFPLVEKRGGGHADPALRLEVALEAGAERRLVALAPGGHGAPVDPVQRADPFQ